MVGSKLMSIPSILFSAKLWWRRH